MARNETKRNRTEHLYKTVLLSKIANVLNDNCRFQKRNGTLLEPGLFFTHTVYTSCGCAGSDEKGVMERGIHVQ